MHVRIIGPAIVHRGELLGPGAALDRARAGRKLMITEVGIVEGSRDWGVLNIKYLPIMTSHSGNSPLLQKVFWGLSNGMVP